jgi:hypothetical protein
LTQSPAVSASAIKTAISTSCCTAPHTSPVYPPICRFASSFKAGERSRDEHADDPASQPCGWNGDDESRDERDFVCGSRRDTGRGGHSVNACRRHAGHQGDHAVSRQRARGNERGRRIESPCIEYLVERREPQDHREKQRQDAEGADAAVAHDGELSLLVSPAPKTVGRVGKPILMQRAGHNDECSDREGGGEQGRKAYRCADHEHDGTGGPDDRSGDGECARGAAEIELFGRAAHYRQPR